MSKTPPSKSHDPTTPTRIERRDFLKKAATFTSGTLIASSASTTYAENSHDAHKHTGDHAGHQMAEYSSMMFEKHQMQPGRTIIPPGSPPPEEVDYKVYNVEVRIVEHEILPGIKTHVFAFNGQVPGPEFHVTEGEWIQVNFTNHTEEMHTIHWHGLVLPYTMDGVPMVTQDPVHPGETFVYRFQAKPAGTRWYHCHWNTPLHAASAMHGAFVIHPEKDTIKERYPYTRDYTLMLEAWDTDFIREEMNGLLEGMKQVNHLMAEGKLDPATHGFFRNYTEFKQAFDDGRYVPPYLQSRSSGKKIEPNFFAINGKAYPATQRIGIKHGEWIRVRMINASGISHHMHLHGHDFWWVAQDGNELQQHRRLNTLHVEPGGTYDVIVFGDNPGFWTWHDHTTTHVRNNGIYPGGMLTMLVYEDFTPSYTPSLSIDQ
ncbi:MAG: multicopper oxidase domain-containing protein [Gammaproteobacteria bacterium]|nr:multicopper oxidase domain-containing protein [Gammaproteobacteria bacterium]